jgi:uncharacterized damage-inducible protein DinB
MSRSRLNAVLELLHPLPGRKLWHGGATALGALRGVSWQEAVWKPAPDRHSIWELALHIAYWEYAVRRRLTGERRGQFPRSPSNWPALPEKPSTESWKEDRELVRDVHESLMTVVRSFDPADFDETAGKGEGYTFGDLLFGAVLHDTYHAGQIQIMKRLYLSLK